MGHCQREQHEAELARLRQCERHAACALGRVAGHARQQVQHPELHDDQACDEQCDAARLLEQQADVGYHADGHEEQAEQQALERLDVGFELMTVLAVGEQEPGDEGA